MTEYEFFRLKRNEAEKRYYRSKYRNKKIAAVRKWQADNRDKVLAYKRKYNAKMRAKCVNTGDTL